MALDWMGAAMTRVYHPRPRAWYTVAVVDGHRRWVRCEVTS